MQFQIKPKWTFCQESCSNARSASMVNSPRRHYSRCSTSHVGRKIDLLRSVKMARKRGGGYGCSGVSAGSAQCSVQTSASLFGHPVNRMRRTDRSTRKLSEIHCTDVPMKPFHKKKKRPTLGPEGVHCEHGQYPNHEKRRAHEHLLSLVPDGLFQIIRWYCFRFL